LTDFFLLLLRRTLALVLLIAHGINHGFSITQQLQKSADGILDAKQDEKVLCFQLFITPVNQ